MNQVDPLASFRAFNAAGDELVFFEVHVFPGPEEVAEIGNGTLRERYGFNWAVVITTDRVLLAFREEPTGSGEWVPVTERLPSVFGSVLPAGVRRLTGAFDQSGRIAVAFEFEQMVLVTRWDVVLNDYVQNVSFPGVNPALAMDLHAGIPTEDSDLQVYYQPVGDLSRVHCRIQRDLYLVVYEVWAGDQDIILDRAHVSGLQLQLFVSDEFGEQLRVASGEWGVLAGPYYPRFVRDGVLLSANPTRGVYEETTLVAGVRDGVMLGATVVNPDGLSGEPETASTTPQFGGTPPVGLWGEVRSGQANIVGSAPVYDDDGVLVGGCSTSSEVVNSRVFFGGDGVSPGSHVFDVVPLSAELFPGKYGIRGVGVFFRVLWRITRGEVGRDRRVDTVRLFRVVDGSCVIEESWRAYSRTLVVELGISDGGPPGEVTDWVELYRHVETPSAEPGSGWDDPVAGKVTEHSFQLDLSVLASPLARNFFLRVRVLPDEPLRNNSLSAALLGGYTFQLDALTNAYVSNVLRRSITDGVTLGVTPTPAEYESNTMIQGVADGVALGVAPSRGEHVHYVVALPAPVDRVLISVRPTVAEYREV